MSGKKAAEVRPKLKKAAETARRQLIESNKNARRLNELNSQTFFNRQNEARRRLQELETLSASATLLKYAPEKTEELTRRKAEIAALVQQGEETVRAAERLRGQAEATRQGARIKLERVLSEVDRIEERLRYGLGWFDREDADAKRARSQANEALQAEKSSTDQLTAALDQNRNAQNKYDSAVAKFERFKRDFQNAEKQALDREKAAQVAEENRRQTELRRLEAEGIVAEIEALDREKFAPGEFRGLAADVEAFRRLSAAQKFDQAAKSGESLCSRLKTFLNRVSKLQAEFETAQIAARNNLASAREEIATLDREELARWSSDPDAISAAYSRLDDAENALNEERFSDANEATRFALNALRNAAKTSADNKTASESRFSLAEAIMNALYEQGYDAPTFYYSQQKPDGDDVEFSNLTVFAKAPGKRGDMRLNIDLEGKIELEVEGIADGEEVVCRQLIEDLQKGVGEEIDFQMTDWGRAAGTDVETKVEMRDRVKEQEKIRKREKNG